DNMSTALEVEKLYAEYSGRVSIYRYSGFHNFLHQRAAYPELYLALRKSCSHFAILDTDERLALFDDGRLKFDKTVVRFVADNDDLPALPGTWIANLPRSDVHFRADQSALASGLVWGKPIVSSRSWVRGSALHNVEFAGLFSVHTPLN